MKLLQYFYCNYKLYFCIINKILSSFLNNPYKIVKNFFYEQRHLDFNLGIFMVCYGNLYTFLIIFEYKSE